MATHLVRVDVTRNVHRFYRLDVQPDLFGTVSLIKEWGRIGQAGTVRMATFNDVDAAEAALMKLLATKTRRGYHACEASGIEAIG